MNDLLDGLVDVQEPTTEQLGETLGAMQAAMDAGVDISPVLVGPTPPSAMGDLPATAVQVEEPKQLAKKLRQETAAVRLRRAKWGTTRRLDRGQVEKAAGAFAADARYLGASKKLISRGNEKYRACAQVIRDAVEYWKAVTIPYPENGVRLIRKERVEQFVQKLVEFRNELEQKAAELDAGLEEIIQNAREHLGELFRDEDYPVGGVAGLFKLEWDFPSCEPSAYLMQLSPALYQAEQAKIQARFEQAIALAEEGFTEKFHELVAHMADRLAFGEDGKPKTFQASTVENLKDFFEQFRALNVGSNPDLDALVTQAQELVGGVEVKTLRNDVTTRASIKEAMDQIAAKLDTMLVNRPARQFDFEDADGDE